MSQVRQDCISALKHDVTSKSCEVVNTTSLTYAGHRSLANIIQQKLVCRIAHCMRCVYQTLMQQNLADLIDDTFSSLQNNYFWNFAQEDSAFDVIQCKAILQ
jgi:hypothetical protein